MIPRPMLAVALFGIGVFLSVLVFFIGHYAAANAFSIFRGTGGYANRAAVVHDDVAGASVQQSGIPAPVVANMLSPEKLVEVMSFAIDEGTLDSLQVVRTEYVREIPHYRSLLLPELKRQALEELLDKFVLSDWNNWPRSIFGGGTGPSVARRFLNDVITVNVELGRFLETSAQLMHGLYRSTSRGFAYDVGNDLRQVIQQAEQLRSAQPQNGVPALEAYDLSVPDDPVFRVLLERKRCEFSHDYFVKNPRNYTEYLHLVAFLQPRYCSKKTAGPIANLLSRLAIDGSPEFRKMVLFDNAIVKVIEGFASLDNKVRTAAGGLYLVSSLDALDSADIDSASRLLDIAVKFAPELSSQNAVREAIANYKQELPSQSQMDYTRARYSSERYLSNDRDDNGAHGMFDDLSSSRSDSMSVSFGFGILIILALIFSIMSLLRIFNRNKLRAKRRSAIAYRRAKKATNGSVSAV